MNLYYHGTNWDNAQQILKKGFRADDAERVWNVSHERCHYLWGPNEENYDPWQRASESSMFSLPGSDVCKAVILEVSLKNIKVQPDETGTGMAEDGAVEIARDLRPLRISRYWVSENLSGILPNILAMVSTHDYYGKADYHYCSPLMRYLVQHVKPFDEPLSDLPITWTEHRTKNYERIYNQVRNGGRAVPV